MREGPSPNIVKTVATFRWQVRSCPGPRPRAAPPSARPSPAACCPPRRRPSTRPPGRSRHWGTPRTCKSQQGGGASRGNGCVPKCCPSPATAFTTLHFRICEKRAMRGRASLVRWEQRTFRNYWNIKCNYEAADSGPRQSAAQLGGLHCHTQHHTTPCCHTAVMECHTAVTLVSCSVTLCTLHPSHCHSYTLLSCHTLLSCQNCHTLFLSLLVYGDRAMLGRDFYDIVAK